MPGDLVLLTGGTGHVGFRALRYALEYGYQVRAAVRSEAKAEAIRSNPALQAMKIPDGQLTFAIVPDILAPTAYDEAIKGVKYVIHIASPLANAPDDDYDKHIIQPAIRGTLNIAEAAQKAGGIKRIVITSSVIAITPLSALGDPGSAPRFDANSRIPEYSGPYDSAFAAYAQSKVAALNRTEAWVKENKPSFDIVYIMPSFVEGRNDLTTTLSDFQNGTNRFIVDLARGIKSQIPFQNNQAYVDDVALTHVKGLDPHVPGNEGYVISTPGDDGQQWEDVKNIIAKKFPQALKKGVFSLDGHQPTVIVKYDASKTERVFGIKLASFETQAISVLEHYLEVYQKEKGGL